MTSSEAVSAFSQMERNVGILNLRSVGNPFLGTVDDPMLAILGLGRCRLQTEDVATRMRFGDLYSTPDHPSIKKTQCPLGK